MIAGIIVISICLLALYLCSTCGNIPDMYIKKSGIIYAGIIKTDEKAMLYFNIVQDSIYCDTIKRNFIKRWKFKPYCTSTVDILFENDETRELFKRCGALEEFVNDTWHGLECVEIEVQN